MISNDGKRHIKRYLAGSEPAIAQSIAFGIGRTAASADDTRLEFEVSRTDIELVSYDFIADRLIFKTSLPSTLLGEIHEIALYTSNFNTQAGQYGSRILFSFDSLTEDWSGGTFVVDEARLGGDSLNHSPAVSSTVTSELAELYFDLSGYSGADTFLLSANIGNNVDGVTLRFLTDSSNYYEVDLGAQSPGYKVLEFSKASFVATGSPSWEEINVAQISTTASAAGAGGIDFDGLRIEDVDTINSDYAMVAREVLETPHIKRVGQLEEIEFSLGVNI